MSIACVIPLVEQLGLPTERLRFAPIVLQRYDGRHDERLCELFDGVLVEKPMGAPEARMGFRLANASETFVRPQRLGFTFAGDGPFAFAAQHYLIPDMAFVRRTDCPNGRLPRAPVCPIIPVLVAEVLSDSNTVAEMRFKRQVYFAAGVKLVWEVDIQLRTVAVYTQPDVPDVVLNRTQTLDGGAVLPGFALGLADWFDELD